MKKFKLLKYNLLKNILLILISLLTIEILCQSVILLLEGKKYSILFKPFSNNTERKIFQEEYKFNWDFSTNRMVPGTYERKEIIYTINSKGFRGKEFNIHTNLVRIISFGGSTTIGLGSPDDKTYPQQLENLLNQKSLKYEVLNFGFGSKSLNFIKSLFFNEAIIYKPKIITIYSNRNSIMYDGSYVDINLSKNPYLLKMNYFLQENIMTYRVIYKTFKRIKNYKNSKGFLKSPYGTKGLSKVYLLEGYTNSLKEIINYCKKNETGVILIKQAYFINPEITFFLEKFSIDELIAKHNNNFLLKNYQVNEEDQFWLIMGTILNKQIDKLKNYSNVKIVNPIPELLKNKENFKDMIHLTPRGNFVLAKEIYKAL